MRKQYGEGKTYGKTYNIRNSNNSQTETMLITIVRANTENTAHLQAEDFDDAIEQIIGETAEIVRPTRAQVYKGTEQLNGNRLVIITTPPDKSIIPDTISVPDPEDNNTPMTFKLSFFGKTRFCRRCRQRESYCRMPKSRSIF